jgi:hypothetical protein
LALAAAGRPAVAVAMQFQPDTSDTKLTLISGNGEIIQGDLARLRKALAAAPPGRTIALVLDSPGGLVAEADKMGHVIRDEDVAVVIPGNGKCISACFLLLAAATRRFADAEALVGVHSASESGEETTESMAATTLMAHVAAGYGVPPAIVGKMIGTVSGRVEWLTHDDLAAMGVKIIDATDPAASPRHQAAARTLPSPATSPATSPAPSPAPALGFPPAPAPGFAPTPTLGFPPETAPAPAATPLPVVRRVPDAPAVAEYQGAYFCGGPTTLSLKVMDVAESGRRRAVFSFGPTATNPQVAPGVFWLEGRLDLAGGVLDMQPVSGSSHPGGTAMVGLVGRSDDGGKTFAGHVTANIACTLFTLRRIR